MGDTNILYDLQYGFRSKRSTETQILTFTLDGINNLRDNGQTDVIIMHFAKAFHKVPHNKLLKKLEEYGVKGPFTRWIESFLSQREQWVVCEGEKLSWVPITSGVPHGSVVGPILFLVYSNNLPDGLKSIVRLFPDDTFVYMTLLSASNAETLQADLDLLVKWEKYFLYPYSTLVHTLRFISLMYECKPDQEKSKSKSCAI